MTNEQWAEIEPYANAKAAAEAAFSNAQAMNMATDLRKQVEQTAYFERLRVEMQAASA